MHHERPSRIQRLREFVHPPVRTVLMPAAAFLRTEAGGGIVLLLAAVAAVVWANSPWDEDYVALLHYDFAVDLYWLEIREDLQHWINDGLMAVFFFVVGLEIKREVLRGELASPRRAALPAAGALGGMLLPAFLYFLLNPDGAGSRGWGIPMATDIAFAIGVLALLGNRIPFGLKVFLLALAIVDDLGAIAVIAVFYTEEIAFEWLAAGAGFAVLIVFLQRLGVRSLYAYGAVGVALWVTVLESGVHATLAGVVLGILTPAAARVAPETYAERVQRLLDEYEAAREAHDHERAGQILLAVEELSQDAEAPLDRLEHALHPWSSYVVIPVFALANAGLVFTADTIDAAITSSVTLGIVVGLLAGKVAGILLASWIAVRLGFCALPGGTSWRHITGAAMLAGIGFTVSLFITNLAFTDPVLADEARIGIFAASLMAGLFGFLWLRLSCQPMTAEAGEEEQAARTAASAVARSGG